MSKKIEKLKNIFESNITDSSPSSSPKIQQVTPKSSRSFHFPTQPPSTQLQQKQNKFKTIPKKSIESSKFTTICSTFSIRTNSKILVIENCDSATDAVNFITNNFDKITHKFLIILQIRQQWNEINIESFEQKLQASKISQVYVFESKKNFKIFVNFNGLKIFNVIEKIDEKDFEENVNFSTFLCALKSNICGDFTDSIINIKIDEEKFKEFLKTSILNCDLVLLNFLKLFEINFEALIDDQNRVLEIAASIPNSLSFFSLVNDNREKVPTTSTLRRKNFDEVLKLKSKNKMTLLEIATRAENFDICEFLISTKYFNIEISDILENAQIFYENCVGLKLSSENFNQNFLIAKFMIEHIMKTDFTSIEDEFDISLRLKLLWQICSEKENLSTLRYINSYLMTNFETLEVLSFEFLREFIKSKINEGYLLTLKRKFHRSNSKFDLTAMIINFFNENLDFVAKYFLKILDNDLKVLIKNSPDLVGKIIDSEIFEYFWHHQCGKKLKMTILTIKSNENFSNLVKIIKKFNNDKEKLMKFYSDIVETFDTESIEKYLKKRCGYDEQWTNFEENAINILKFVPNAIENFKIFFKFAEKVKINFEDRIELFAKLKTQVKYEMSTSIYYEMLLEYFNLIEKDEEKSELLNHKNEYGETILNEISWQVDENLIKNLLKIIRKFSHDPSKFLDGDKFGKNAFMKVCHSHYGKNVEIFWKFIKKIYDEDQQKELLSSEDVNRQKPIFYGLIIPHNDDGNGQVQFLIDLYLKFFKIDEVKNFVIAKNALNETILFLAMKHWGKVNETFWKFLINNFNSDEIKKYLGERNTLGWTAFCKSDDHEENIKIMDRTDLQIAKYVKDHNFKMEEILELITVKSKVK